MLLPNQLTIIRIILTPIFLILFLSDNSLSKQISLGIYIIAAITDWYDGWLARKFNYITNWGKFMDPLADKILTSAAFLAFAFMGILKMWMVLLVIIRDFIITGMRLYADYKGINMSTSYLAKWKTFLQMIFIYYLLLVFTLKTVDSIYKNHQQIFAILTNTDFVNISMLIITLFTVLTGITYIIDNKALLKKIFVNEN